MDKKAFSIAYEAVKIHEQRVRSRLGSFLCWVLPAACSCLLHAPAELPFWLLLRWPPFVLCDSASPPILSVFSPRASLACLLACNPDSNCLPASGAFAGIASIDLYRSPFPMPQLLERISVFVVHVALKDLLMDKLYKVTDDLIWPQF